LPARKISFWGQLAVKARLAAEVGFRGEDPKFMGFDGSNETEYLSIAQFLVDEMRRFESFKGRSFNSHMPIVARYLGMYRLFEPMRAKLIGRELGIEDLIALLKHVYSFAARCALPPIWSNVPRLFF
jgi:hypothetical protein